jgi:hypothetical protein
MTMRLNEVKRQRGDSALLTLPPACVCGTGSNEPTSLAQPAVVPTCATCGGSVHRPTDTARPASRERRQLQDFLSAFV